MNPGYRLALLDRDSAAPDALQARLGPDRCLTCPRNVTCDDDLVRFGTLITAQADPLRLTFANAGIPRSGELLAQNPDGIEQLFAVNVMGTIRTVRALVPLMQMQALRSTFVFTDSTSMLTVAAVSP